MGLSLPSEWKKMKSLGEADFDGEFMPNISKEGEESERRQTMRQRGAEQRQEQEQDFRESREVGSMMRSMMSKEFCCTNAFI